MSGEPSAELLANYRAGDERAAATLYERYIGRLTRLAASRLSAKLARRTDAGRRRAIDISQFFPPRARRPPGS